MTEVTKEIQDSQYADAVCVITGGTGSVGLELASALLRQKPREVRLFSNDENGLFEAMSLFSGRPEVTYKLGDVRDTRTVESVIKGSDVVFHAAALKHVDFCETNPYEAITTNIVGTQNVIDQAIKCSLRRFVFISTDKAVNPAGTMGATKLLGEKLVVSASTVTNRPIFSVVRFGNVHGSRGSVVLIFERQVRSGRDITVTDPGMTRFIMLPADSARLVLDAGRFPESGRLLIMKMKAARIIDLADACREFFARMYGRDAATIKITQINAGPGEKIHEELMTEEEALTATETPEFFIIKPDTARIASSLRESAGRPKPYSSDSVELMAKEEITRLLSELYR